MLQTPRASLYRRSDQSAGISEFTLSTPHPHPDSDGMQPAVPPVGLLGPRGPHGPSLLRSAHGISPRQRLSSTPSPCFERATKQFHVPFSPELAMPGSAPVPMRMGSSELPKPPAPLDRLTLDRCLLLSLQHFLPTAPETLLLGPLGLSPPRPSMLGPLGLRVPFLGVPSAPVSLSQTTSWRPSTLSSWAHLRSLVAW